MASTELLIEQGLIRKFEELKYTYRPDIRDKVALERNFRDKFEALNRVRLTDAEFARLRDEIKRLEAVDLAIADDPLARQSAVEAASEAATGRSTAGRPGQRGGVKRKKKR